MRYVIKGITLLEQQLNNHTAKFLRRYSEIVEVLSMIELVDSDEGVTVLNAAVLQQALNYLSKAIVAEVSNDVVLHIEFTRSSPGADVVHVTLKIHYTFEGAPQTVSVMVGHYGVSGTTADESEALIVEALAQSVPKHINDHSNNGVINAIDTLAWAMQVGRLITDDAKAIILKYGGKPGHEPIVTSDIRQDSSVIITFYLFDKEKHTRLMTLPFTLHPKPKMY